MSASLVGSEMCIRDRFASPWSWPRPPGTVPMAASAEAPRPGGKPAKLPRTRGLRSALSALQSVG
eukprot:3029394-Alexandrium_andersonii.AAC.1